MATGDVPRIGPYSSLDSKAHEVRLDRDRQKRQNAHHQPEEPEDVVEIHDGGESSTPQNSISEDGPDEGASGFEIAV